MKRIICSVVVISLMLATSGLYLWGIFVDGHAPTDRLIQLLAIEFSCLAALVRIFKGTARKRRDLSFYEHHYAAQLGRAFEGDQQNKRHLLQAIRLYNENKFDNAIEELFQVGRSCRNTYDRQAVWMFTALCYSDSDRPDAAIATYEKLLDEDPYHNTALGNLAILYMNKGRYDDAEVLYRRAIDAAPQDGLGYHNLGSLYYRMGELERAEEMLRKALEKKHTLYQAAATLSIILALRGDVQGSQKYFEQALANGQNPQALRATIDRRLAEQAEVRRFADHLAHKTADFDGDIIITDPSYIVSSDEDWARCKYGEQLDMLGFHRFLTFSHGDAVGTTLVNTDTDEFLGEFASDSCMVSVLPLADVLAYRADVLQNIPEDCYTVIRQFCGTVRAEMDEEDHTADCWKLVGDGSIRFESTFE